MADPATERWLKGLGQVEAAPTVAAEPEEPAPTPIPSLQPRGAMQGAPTYLPGFYSGFGPDPKTMSTDFLAGTGPLLPGQRRARGGAAFVSGGQLSPENEPLMPGFLLPEQGSRVSSDELGFLDSLGLLYDPVTGQPKYPLTPDFLKKKASMGNVLGASPVGLFLSGTQEVGKTARYGGELAMRELGGMDPFTVHNFHNQVRIREEEKGSKLNHWEKRDLFDEVFEAPKYTRGTAELAAELVIPGTASEKLIGNVAEWGLKGAWKGASYFGGRFLTRSAATEVAGAIPDVAKVVEAPTFNFFGLPQLKVGTTRQEKLGAALSDTSVGYQHHLDDLAENVNNGVQQAQRNSESLASSITAELDGQVKNAFDFADNGTIPSLRNINPDVRLPPTLADVAANLPAYQNRLSDDQIRVLGDIRTRLEPIKDSMDELGIEIGERPDIMEGGFYIPRGRAFVEEAEEEIVTGVGRRGGAGFQKTIKFASESEGITRGYTYMPFRDSVDDYIRNAGRKVSQRWAGKVLREATDLDGQLIGSTMLMRLSKDPVYNTGRQLVSRINNVRLKLIRSNTRFTERTASAKRAARRAERIEKGTVREAERIRAGTTAEGTRAVARTQQALERYEAVQGVFNASDLRAARQTLNKNITYGRDVTHRIRMNLEELKRVKTKLRSGDRKLARDAEKLRVEMDDAEKLSQTIGDDPLAFEGAGNLGLKYEQLAARSDRLEKRWLNMAEKQFALEDRLQEVLNKKDLLEGTDAIKIAERKRTFKVQQEMLKAQRVESQLKTAWQTLEREQNRIFKALDKKEQKEIRRLQKEIGRATGEAEGLDEKAVRALINLHETDEALSSLKQQYRDIHAELTYAKRTASEHPRGMITVRIPGLEGYSFPARLASSINKVIEEEMPISGGGKQVLEAIGWHASLWRGLRATLDDSAPVIQGLLRLFDNPIMAGRAFGWHIMAWGRHGDELLGSFIGDFNRKASAQGRLTTDDMAREGLRIAGVDTEFMIGGQKYLSRLGKTPGIRHANRAFGFYGDRLRIDWMDGAIDDLLREGRTIEDLVESGDLRDLAKQINSATGYAEKRFGGSFGDVLMFAPRFFQSRLESAARAGTGIVKDPLGNVEAIPMVGGAMRRGLGGGARDIPLRQRMARRSMLRMIAGGTMLTVGLNEMLGNKTDFDILKQDKEGTWHYNSNFMRVRFGGRDWSLFGTWDSMLRLMIMTGTGFQGGESPIDGFRGLASGPVSLGWDLISGETFEGKEPKAGWMPDGPDWMPGDEWLKKAGYIMESHLPFAAEEAPEVIGKIAQGDIGGAAGLSAGEFFGGKSSPMSYNDLKQEISKEKREGGVKSPTAFGDDLGWDPERLSEGEKDIIQEDPRMEEYLEKLKADNTSDLSRAFDALGQGMVAAEKDIKLAIDSGAEGRRLRSLIQGLKRDRAILFESFEDFNKEELDKIATPEEDINAADLWAQKYYNVELQIFADSGFMDFETHEKDRQKVLDEAAEVHPDLVEYITGTGEGTFRGKRFENESVRRMVDEYETDLQVMREYYDIPMKVAKLHGLEEEYREYLKSPNQAAYLDRGKHKAKIKAIIKESGRQKEAFRLRDWHLEAKLYKWGAITSPVNNIVKGIEEKISQERQASGQGPIVSLNDVEKHIQIIQGSR